MPTHLLPVSARHFYFRNILAISLVGGFSYNCIADPLNQAIDTQLKTEQHSIRTQQQIEKLDDETRSALDAYRQATEEYRSLKAYDDQLERLINSQQRERDSLQHQLREIEITQRNITPLMERMLSVLDRFVELDTPFLKQERAMRLQALHQLKDRSDVSLAEKYRRLIEAYQVEMDYGRTIEAYQDKLKIGDSMITVDLLRFGRVGLYYLSLDQQHAGIWDSKSKRWAKLPDSYRSVIREGLAMARKQTPPQLLRLPVTVSEVAQ